MQQICHYQFPNIYHFWSVFIKNESINRSFYSQKRSFYSQKTLRNIVLVDQVAYVLPVLPQAQTISSIYYLIKSLSRFASSVSQVFTISDHYSTSESIIRSFYSKKRLPNNSTDHLAFPLICELKKKNVVIVSKVCDYVPRFVRIFVICDCRILIDWTKDFLNCCQCSYLELLMVIHEMAKPRIGNWYRQVSSEYEY